MDEKLLIVDCPKQEYPLCISTVLCISPCLVVCVQGVGLGKGCAVRRSWATAGGQRV